MRQMGGFVRQMGGFVRQMGGFVRQMGGLVLCVLWRAIRPFEKDINDHTLSKDRVCVQLNFILKIIDIDNSFH